MSTAFKKNITDILSHALIDINEIIGYEYFDPNKLDEISKKFLVVLPFADRMLEQRRGVTIQDLEKETFEREKAKKAAIRGVFDGIIIRNYKGNSFQEKLDNYLYHSGIEQSVWISKTGYDLYYRTLHEVISRDLSDRNTINFIHRFTKRKVKSTTQALIKIQTKEKFFKNPSKIDEMTIDEHLDIFREAGAITENYLKLIYGIKHNYDTDQEIEDLEKTKFYQIWKEH